jgi:hypothetical protein
MLPLNPTRHPTLYRATLLLFGNDLKPLWLMNPSQKQGDKVLA